MQDANGSKSVREPREIKTLRVGEDAESLIIFARTRKLRPILFCLDITNKKRLPTLLPTDVKETIGFKTRVENNLEHIFTNQRSVSCNFLLIIALFHLYPLLRSVTKPRRYQQPNLHSRASKGALSMLSIVQTKFK